MVSKAELSASCPCSVWTAESQPPSSLCPSPLLRPTLSTLGLMLSQMKLLCLAVLTPFGALLLSEEPAPQVGLGLCHGGFCLGHQDRQNQLILPVGLSFPLEPGWSLCPVSVSDPAPGPPETGDPDPVRRCPSV